MEKYYEDVFRFLRGLTRDEQLAEELTQETFYRAYKNADSFRGDSDMRVWLCSIAKNLFYTHCKKQQREFSFEEIEIREEKSLTEILENKELALQIHRILHNIKEPYKEIFSLRVFGELSFRDIGTLFEKSEHWACVTFHRAKMMIQSELQKSGYNREV